MRKLSVFESVSIDGYFCDDENDMSWAHRGPDPEFDGFVGENAGSGGTLLFGRVTYDLMKAYWPTPQALKDDRTVAEGMNDASKIVFSRSLREATWKNTKVVNSDPASAVRELKQGSGGDLVVLGSGSIVSLLTRARLVDQYQLVVVPIIVGKGRTLFEGVKDRPNLKLKKSRPFKNGNVVLWYEFAK